MTNKFQACSSCLMISNKVTRASYHIHTCQVHIFICLDTKQIYRLACDCTNPTYLDKASLSSSDISPCATDEMSFQQHTRHILSRHASTGGVSSHCCLQYECLKLWLWSWLLLSTANRWFRITKYADHNTYYREAWGI
jgi:hypothetical protein